MAAGAQGERKREVMDMFIFGVGYSARAFARVAGRDAVIAGTTRRAENLARLQALGIETFLLDGSGLPAAAAARLSSCTHVLVSAAPDEEGDPILRLAGTHLQTSMPRLEWIGYLSTVGVYGDHRGAWVDEQTHCRPVSRRSTWRLEAERNWTELGRAIDVPVAVLRLGGIYGPGRNTFIKLERGTARRLVKPGQVFNRIHVEDIGRAIEFLARCRSGGIFNVTDDEPAPPQDVVAFAASLTGVAAPPEIPFDEAELSPMQRSFYGENKRVSNAKLKQAGFRFRYPDYRASLAAMWRDGAWRAE